MNFLANSFQPAAGVISRVQLPAVGQVTLAHPALSSARTLPSLTAVIEQNRLRTGLAQQRTQHRAQCRANCMSKANF